MAISQDRKCQKVRDLESMLLKVEDRESREHFAEAVRSYGAGAFRAAIISTWVAVAFDLISKMRYLAEEGGAARTLIQGLEESISKGDVRALQVFENGLLGACEELNIIDKNDLRILKRLQEDRHLCAHPAYVSTLVPFSPTPELTRSHMASAIDSVLATSPIQEKGIDRVFRENIAGRAFPSDLNDLREYLREQYFGKHRESAQRKISELIVKSCISLPEDLEERALISVRYARCAQSLELVSPVRLHDAIESVVKKMVARDNLKESEMLSAVASLGRFPEFWQHLSDSYIGRIVACVANVGVDELIESRVFGATLADLSRRGDLESALSARLEDVNASALVQVHILDPSPCSLARLIDKFVDAESYQVALDTLPVLADEASKFSIEQVERICRASAENSQIYGLSLLMPIWRKSTEPSRVVWKFFPSGRTSPR